MSIPVIDPGGRGRDATQDVAALIAGITLPHIAPFDSDNPELSGLPPYTPVPAPDPEPPSRVSVARGVFDSAMAALAAVKCLEDRTAAVKATLVARAVAANKVEGAALALDAWQARNAESSAVAEVAVTLCIPERTAGLLALQATELLTHPDTLHALGSGLLSWRHATIIIHECQTLTETPGITPAALHSFEVALLTYAPGTTASGFATKARRERESKHPETLPTRNKQAITKREMTLEPGKDGMSWLTLHVPAPAAEGIWLHCTRTARKQQGPNEHRTLTQLRIDTASALLLGQHVITPADNSGTAKPTQDHPDLKQPYFVNDGVTLIDVEPVWIHAPRSPVIGPLTQKAAHSAATHASAPENIPIAGFLCANEPLTGTTNSEEVFVGAVAGDGTGFVNGVVDGLPEDPLKEYLCQLETTRNGAAITDPPLPEAQIIITVPVLGLLGATNEPAVLAGHGPIPETIARKLLDKAGTFLRVLTDPITGKPLDSAPDRYRLRAKEKAVLRAMAETCSWPNCTSPALDTETDHIKAWEQGGETTAANEQPLCKRHHNLKHFRDDKDKHGRYRVDRSPERAGIRLRGWKPTMTGDGHVGWTSPTGKYHPPRSPQTNVTAYPKWVKKDLEAYLGNHTWAP